MNEGSMWESLLLAAHRELENLTVIVDSNHSGDRALSLGRLAEKCLAFGCDVTSGHGHDHTFLEAALRKQTLKPHIVIAETTKGKGCRSMENNPQWHHKNPTPDELMQLLEELHHA